MRKLFIVIVLGSVIVLVFVFVQVLDVGYIFIGLCVEVILGYDINKVGSSVDDDVNQGNDQFVEGLFYGVGVGYDVDFGLFVVGVEVELIDFIVKIKFENGDFEGFGFGNVKVNCDIYVGVCVGVKVNLNLLVYVKGGYINVKFDVCLNDGIIEFNDDIDIDGYWIGVGVEYVFGINSFVKFEYCYLNYKKVEIDFGGMLFDSLCFNVDIDCYQIVVGFGYCF